ncbi:hypothetical protein ACQP2P_41275 [Dactylosporangium sp. CA-139114]|uniref:hypothetical protein n=1 Tax=Dactylosporangium sp. CA-139114 TaxID=3239931 RepID=UPI003D9750EE
MTGPRALVVRPAVAAALIGANDTLRDPFDAAAGGAGTTGSPGTSSATAPRPRIPTWTWTRSPARSPDRLV